MFEKVVNGIRSLVEAGVSTAVNITLTAPTIDDCVPTYRLAVEQLGANALVAIKFFPGGYGQVHREVLDLSYDTWSRVFVDLTRRKLKGEIPAMEISVPAAWEFYLPLIGAGIDVSSAEEAWGYQSPLRERHYRATCSIGDTAALAEMSIGGDGTVYPSVLFAGLPRAAAGNVRERSLAEIWRDAPVLEAMRHLGVAQLAARCAACSFVDICGGGSRARAFASSGAFDAIDDACPLARPASPPTLRLRKGSKVGRATQTTPVVPMRVIGHGARALRIFFTESGCQIRTQAHVVTCDARQARLVAAMLHAEDGRNGPAREQEKATETELTDAATRLVVTLRGVGVAEEVISELGRAVGLCTPGVPQP